MRGEPRPCGCVLAASRPRAPHGGLPPSPPLSRRQRRSSPASDFPQERRRPLSHLLCPWILIQNKHFS
jgi:hypothetical protein